MPDVDERGPRLNYRDRAVGVGLIGVPDRVVEKHLGFGNLQERWREIRQVAQERGHERTAWVDSVHRVDDPKRERSRRISDPAKRRALHDVRIDGHSQAGACQSGVGLRAKYHSGVGAAEFLVSRPSPRPKARFTNLASTLNWAQMVLWQLAEGQRLPVSTEIPESSFGLFKQLERQHSKGGFTSLLAPFGALLKPATPESIRRDFARVSVKQMRTWVNNNLKTTLASKRQTAYAEAAAAA